MSSRRILATVLLAAGLLATSTVTGQEPSSEAVVLLLKAYDHFPDASAFKRVSENPRAELLAIQGDPTQPEIIRLQALDALSLFPSPEVRALYLGMLAATKNQPLADREVHNAINGLMMGWGPASLQDVLGLLEHQDMQVRLTVVYAVARSGGEEGRELLRAHFDKEKEEVVRQAIREQAISLN